MQLKKEVAAKIARDAVISLFIYALPVILMFVFFRITGQRPWEKRANQSIQTHAH
jgi:preprotein translocase subunit YajC